MADFAAAGGTPAATAAREELGGEASMASAPWVTNVGEGPWPGRLVLGRLAVAAEGGGPWLLWGEYRYAEASWHRAV